MKAAALLFAFCLPAGAQNFFTPEATRLFGNGQTILGGDRIWLWDRMQMGPFVTFPDMDAAMSAMSGRVTSATAPITWSSGVVGITAASGSASGTMSAADFSKLAALPASMSATAPVTMTGGVIAMPAATASVPGYMTAAYAAKVDALPGSVAGTAPISVTAGVVSISAATTSAAGSMSAADKTKLDGLSAPAAWVFSAPTFSNATTAAQFSATRPASVFYAFDASLVISLLAGQSITATLKYADNAGMSTNIVTLDEATTANSGVLGLNQTNTLRVGGIIPAGKYRQVTFSGTGSATIPTTLKRGQEVLQ